MTLLNLVTLLFLFISPTFGQQLAAKRLAQFNTEDALAIEGYDPVAYFTTGKAIKGSKDFRIEHGGIMYWFISAENENKFKANPNRFEPAYGGWCAYAMGATGEKVAIDPETFKIIDGKLYLFYNAYFNNTLKKWNANESRLKLSADKNWTKLTGQ